MSKAIYIKLPESAEPDKAQKVGGYKNPLRPSKLGKRRMRQQMRELLTRLHEKTKTND